LRARDNYVQDNGCKHTIFQPKLQQLSNIGLHAQLHIKNNLRFKLSILN